MDSEKQSSVDIDILNSLSLDFDTPLTAKTEPQEEAEESNTDEAHLDANNAAFILAEHWAASDIDTPIEESVSKNNNDDEVVAEDEVDGNDEIELIDVDMPTQEQFEAERQKMLEEEEEKKRVSRSVLENERFINTASTKFQLEAEVEEVEKSEPEEIPSPPAIAIPEKKSAFSNSTNLIKPLVEDDFVPPVKQSNMSIGSYLRSVREKLGLSLQQIEDESKISKRYIEALERDDMSELPPAVYVIGHIRKLSVLYHVDSESQDSMCSELKSKTISEHDVPDAVVNSVEQGIEVTEESKREMRKLLWSLISIIVGIVLFVVVIGVWIFSGDSNETPETPTSDAPVVTNATIDNQTLVELLPAPVLKIQELPVKNQ